MRHIMLSRTLSVLCLATVFLLVAVWAPAKAVAEPCHLDQNGGLICGEGLGADRVVDDTISPSRRLAFAWRAPGRLPSEQPDEGTVESVLIRLSDGATLWSTKGIYWNTGTMHANRYNEAAVWSSDSRFAIEVTDVRWWTDTLRLFAVGTGDTILVLDLKAIIEPAVRKHVPPDKGGDFAIFGSADGERPHLTIDDHGLIKALVVVSAPKQQPPASVAFEVAFQAVQKNGQLSARELSIRRRASP
jgi:hypothetical protein